MTHVLTNVVALVTGASGGIGRELCKAMKAAGAIVVATGLGGVGKEVVADHHLDHDVTDPAAWDRIATFIEQAHGRLDVLVNNAGVSIVKKFEDTSLDEWRQIQQVNVESMVIGCQAMLPLLKAGGKARPGGASIVNFSSVYGQRASPLNAAYCASKAAVAMLSKCMGAEFAAYGYDIRVNSVHPGAIETAMTDHVADRLIELGMSPSRDAVLQWVKSTHPIGRMGRAEELAGGVIYLCSEAASYVTCSELNIDGGFAAT
ncbi:SDR family NAD(P)-dependent oxidoreductase [Flavisphingomonas formosensis]|uniref:SDR family NAD(P)-dependent oxidoreductase n=1 Tax=Flavisphingomonas formosensis TaxID=861534 RepID=UPI0012F8549E|nr:SDR family oxidoreductase [Sphingomonas formosensis]